MRRQQYGKADETLKAVLNTSGDNPGIVQRVNLTRERLKRMQQTPAPVPALPPAPIRPPTDPKPVQPPAAPAKNAAGGEGQRPPEAREK